jgi:ABC-2 type transport system permease protein
MVAALLRLRSQVALNALRTEGRDRIVTVVTPLVGLIAVLVVVNRWVHLADSGVDVAGSAIILTGALVVLALAVVPLFTRDTDLLDPRRLALTGVAPTGWAAIMAALVSVPAVLLVILTIGQVIVWAGDALSTLFAVIAVPLIVATGLLALRVALSVAAMVRASRTARRVSRTLAAVVVVAVVGAVLPGAGWVDNLAEAAQHAASVLAWTPLGAAWAAPATAAAGETATAVGMLVLAVLYAAALALLWAVLAHRVLAAREVGDVHQRVGLGWFALLPATSTGVIAARTFSYWGRDARYAVSLVIIPVFPLLLVVPMMIAGIPTGILALIPVPVAALFLGWLIHNDTAHDSNALWLHVVSHTNGIADRLGRALPILIVGVPVLLVGSVVSANVYGDQALLPTMIGVSLGIFFCGVGVSSIVSAVFPYAVVRPGASPFTSPQSADGGASRAQTLTFLGTLLLSAPTLLSAWNALEDGGFWPRTTLLVGLGSGFVVLAAGIVGGGYIFARRRTALLAFSMRN